MLFSKKEHEEKNSIDIEKLRDISHDLRGSYAIISGYKDLAKTHLKKGEDVTDDINAIEEACVKMEEQLDALRRLYRK